MQGKRFNILSMTLFKKLFGSKKNTDFKGSAELMPEERFWSLIAEAFNKAKGEFGAQQEEMKKLLNAMGPQEIIYFDNRFRELRGRAYDWQIWAAAYIIQGGCSDDAFTDFRGWLISQGRDFYYKTLSDPGSLVGIASEKIQVDWEGMGYVAPTVFEDLTGETIPAQFIENQNIKGKEWNEEDEEELKKMFPELWAKYAGN